jgi:hypothetical protein
VYIAASQADNENALQQLCLDIVTYEQRGCFSPQIIYVQTGGGWKPDEVAQWIHTRGMPYIRQRFGSGNLTMDELACLRRALGLYALRGKVLKGTHHSVIRFDGKGILSPSLGGMVVIKTIDDPADIRADLYEYQSYLSALGIAADPDEYDTIASLALEMGFTRHCPVGTMQTPPVVRLHDGLPRLAPLL